MAIKIISVFILILLAAFSYEAPNRQYQGKWEQHKSKYGLSFSSNEEEEKHYANYAKNVATIQAWNSDKSNSFKLGENRLSHMDLETYRATMLMPSMSSTQRVGFYHPYRYKTTTTAKAVSTTKLPSNLNSYVNWTSKFVDIKDQGQCGSCYAFAAAGVAEAAYAMKYGSKISLSEEQIIDCTYYLRRSPNYGCGGGNSYYSLTWAETNPLYSTADYPYISGSADPSDTRPLGSCHSVSSTTSPRISVASVNVATSNEVDLALYVQNHGPVTAYIDASWMSFQSYKSGIYRESKCTQSTDHAVIIVGFGTDSSGTAYWIIRNSWGTSWGMNGYMLMERNKKMCGISTENYSATIN